MAETSATMSRPQSTYNSGTMSCPQSTYNSVPEPTDEQSARGYGSSTNVGAADFKQGHPDETSPLGQSINQSGGAFHEDLGESHHESSTIGEGQHESSTIGEAPPPISRKNSNASTTAVSSSVPGRSNTLKKRDSVKRMSSVIKRSGSKRSVTAGSVADHPRVDSSKEYNSPFTTPIPTTGSPTEVLANRFQQWRQLLKSVITYFREIQASYEMRAKATQKVQQSIAMISHPPIFKKENGLGEATKILEEYHKKSVAESNKSRDIEIDVTGALMGLRSDLSQKIKEIRGLSGDFKNSVEKEKGQTKREIERLQEALKSADQEDGSATGRNDPFVIKLLVDRAVEKQLDEENYLHRVCLPRRSLTEFRRSHHLGIP